MLGESLHAPSLDELRALDERIAAALTAVAAPLDAESARQSFALAALASLDLRPDRSRSQSWQNVRLVSGSPPLWLYWLADRSLIHLFLRWGEPTNAALPLDPGAAWVVLAAGLGVTDLTSFAARPAALQGWAQTSPEDLGEEAPLLSCDLCGKCQLEVQKLIQGPEISICDACIASCAEEPANAKPALIPAELECPLCGKEPDPLSRFVRRAGFEICAECVALCADIAGPGLDDSARDDP